MSTDDDWENLAARDPYWAVMTSDKFKSEHLNKESRDEFFAFGARHVEYVLNALRTYCGIPDTFELSLDFGCGVGRLLLPLARCSRKAIGVDISETMLRICKENARSAGLDNVELVLGDDDLSGITDRPDLLVSYVVLQHIAPERGYCLIENLLQILRPGGFGYLHFTYANTIEHISGESFNPGIRFRAYRRVGDTIQRLARSIVHGPQPMAMNHYDINQLLVILNEHGVSKTCVVHTDHGGHFGVELYFQKPVSA